MQNDIPNIGNVLEGQFFHGLCLESPKFSLSSKIGIQIPVRPGCERVWTAFQETEVSKNFQLIVAQVIR
jgi:hypothetical protein